MPSVNPGPASSQQPNLQMPISYGKFIETIAVSLTPTQIATATTTEQSFGANGATQATAATGILAGDVILQINPPSLAAGVGIVGVRTDVAVNDKFYVQWVTTTTTLTPPAGVYLITVARYNTSNGPTPGTLSSLPGTIY